MGLFLQKQPPFRVYRELVPNEHIVLFADPAEGVDYCAAVGMSKKHMDTPLVFCDKIESSQFGHELYNIAKYIEGKTHIWPTIGVERNTGQATIYVLTNMNYTDMFRMRIFDRTGVTESEKIGWLTTESTRKKMLDDLALLVRQGAVRIYDKQIVDQMKSFIVNKRGRPQAESNKHDDLVFALAGAYQMYQVVPTKESDEVFADDWKKDRDKWRFR